MSYAPVTEIFKTGGWNRFNCPYVLFIITMNAKKNFPTGAGRTFNEGFNSGGGLVYMSSYNLDHHSAQRVQGAPILVFLKSNTARSNPVWRIELDWGIGPPPLQALAQPLGPAIDRALRLITLRGGTPDGNDSQSARGRGNRELVAPETEPVDAQGPLLEARAQAGSG